VDAVGVMTYDWFHNCLQDGVLTVEIQLLLASCQPFGLTRQQIKEDLRDDSWCFPSQVRTKAKQLYRVFDTYRDSASDANRVKCSAAELLSLYQRLRYIIARRVPRAPELVAQLKSFDSACHVVDTILATKRGRLPPAAGALELQRAVSRVLESSQAGFAGCPEMALEWVSEAEFWCYLMFRASPGDLGSPGVDLRFKTQGEPPRNTLARLPSGDQVSQHMTDHIVAYGNGNIKPKHHWNADIPGQIVRDNAVLDLFVIERLSVR